MNAILFIPQYLRWHYTQAWRDLLDNCHSLIRFVTLFFSFRELFKTLFSPWRRLGESYAKGFDPESFLSTFIVNSITRMFGFFVRSIVLIIGLVALLLAYMLSFFIFAAWLLYPIILAFLFGLGLSILS